MVSKRFVVACAAVAVVTLIGQDDNDHGNEKSAPVMVCKVIIVTIITDALVGCLFTLFSSTTDALVGYSITLFLLSKKKLTLFSSSEIETIEDDHVRWTKPEFGWVKLNVDGSHDHKSDPPSSGCGGVLRDASGTWLLGFAQKLDPGFEVHQTEIEAILKGLELAFDMNVEKLVLESDHKPAVSMVNKGVKSNNLQYKVIRRISELRSNPKWKVEVVHVPRGANKVANRLAKDARNLATECLHKYPYPPANSASLVEEDAQVRAFYC